MPSWASSSSSIATSLPRASATALTTSSARRGRGSSGRPPGAARRAGRPRRCGDRRALRHRSPPVEERGVSCEPAPEHERAVLDATRKEPRGRRVVGALAVGDRLDPTLRQLGLAEPGRGDLIDLDDEVEVEVGVLAGARHWAPPGRGSRGRQRGRGGSSASGARRRRWPRHAHGEGGFPFAREEERRAVEEDADLASRAQELEPAEELQAVDAALAPEPGQRGVESHAHARAASPRFSSTRKSRPRSNSTSRKTSASTCSVTASGTTPVSALGSGRASAVAARTQTREESCEPICPACRCHRAGPRCSGSGGARRRHTEPRPADRAEARHPRGRHGSVGVAAAAGTVGPDRGVIVHQDNLSSAAALRSLTRRLQQAAAAGGQPPLLIGVDQEGGSVKTVSWSRPRARPVKGRSAPGRRRTRKGNRRARRWQASGSTRTSRRSTTSRPRRTRSSTGRDAPGRSTRTSPADLQAGLLSAWASVVCSQRRKHFPGLGFATRDTDTSVVRIAATKAELAPGLRPFKTAIADDVPLIMLSNAVYTAYDAGSAASWSPAIGTTLLRRQLGFEGVTTIYSTDGAAQSRHIPATPLAIRAAAAGTRPAPPDQVPAGLAPRLPLATPRGSAREDQAEPAAGLIPADPGAERQLGGLDETWSEPSVRFRRTLLASAARARGPARSRGSHAADDAGADAVAVHDEQRRHLVDAEPFHQLRMRRRPRRSAAGTTRGSRVAAAPARGSPRRVANGPTASSGRRRAAAPGPLRPSRSRRSRDALRAHADAPSV